MDDNDYDFDDAFKYDCNDDDLDDFEHQLDPRLKSLRTGQYPGFRWKDFTLSLLVIIIIIIINRTSQKEVRIISTGNRHLNHRCHNHS